LNSLKLGKNFLEPLLELVLLDQRDVTLTEFLYVVSKHRRYHDTTYSEERLHGGLLVLALQTGDGVELGVKLFTLSLDLVGIMTGDGDYTSDTLGNGSFLGDDEILDDIGRRDVSEMSSCTIAERGQAYVPPQNSILALRHLVSSMFFWISSSG
jgi:hypothetical protein